MAWRPDLGVFPRVADCLCHRAHSNTPLQNSWSRTNSDMTAQSRGTVCELEMFSSYFCRMVPEACIHSELLGPPSSFSSSSLPIACLVHVSRSPAFYDTSDKIRSVRFISRRHTSFFQVGVHQGDSINKRGRNVLSTPCLRVPNTRAELRFPLNGSKKAAAPHELKWIHFPLERCPDELAREKPLSFSGSL